MNDPFLAYAPVLLGTIALGLFRILRSSSPADSLLAVLLLGTTGIGMMLLFATGAQLDGALDMALAAALLAAVIGVAFLLYVDNRPAPAEDDPEESP